MEWSNKIIPCSFIRPPMRSNLFFFSFFFCPCSPLSFVPFRILFMGNLLSGSFSYPHISSLLSFYFSLHFFHSKVKVLYGGTELFDDEVRRTFHSDMLLALFSGACIAVLVYILTSFSCKDCMHFFSLMRALLGWDYLWNHFSLQQWFVLIKQENIKFYL